jgi:hypothetical protein
MEDKDAIPTLGLDGWMKNKHSQMGKLFEYFLASDYSQSNTFYGEIASLKYILASGNDSVKIKDDIVITLTKLYEKHFDTVEVVVEVKESEEESTIEYRIDVNATHGEDIYELSKDISESNGSISNFEALLDELYNEYSR